MSPQLLWTIAGLIITVLTLGGVTISSYQSLDSASAKLVASEMGNVASASKLWLANSSADGTFTGINAAAMASYIPDLTLDGSTPQLFISKAVPKGQDGTNAVKIAVAANATTSKVDITVSNVPSNQQTPLTNALTNKACTLGAFASNSATYTCNG